MIVLSRALELGQDRVLPIHTDSKYTFSVTHAHGAIWKGRGFLNAGNKEIRYGKEIQTGC